MNADAMRVRVRGLHSGNGRAVVGERCARRRRDRNAERVNATKVCRNAERASASPCLRHKSPCLRGFRPYDLSAARPTMDSMSVVTCDHCGELVDVRTSTLPLAYLMRDATAQEPMTYLIIDASDSHHSLLHSCAIAQT